MMLFFMEEEDEEGRGGLVPAVGQAVIAMSERTGVVWEGWGEGWGEGWAWRAAATAAAAAAMA